MPLFRNLVMLLGGAVMLFFAFTFGIFILAILAILGIGFAIYFKLRKKQIINSFEQMGMERNQKDAESYYESEVIDADYEVVDEELDNISDNSIEGEGNKD